MRMNLRETEQEPGYDRWKRKFAWRPVRIRDYDGQVVLLWLESYEEWINGVLIRRRRPGSDQVYEISLVMDVAQRHP